MRKRLLLACLFTVLAGSVAMAQSAVDSVLVSGQADMGSAALGGGRGGVEWVHPRTDQSTLDVGVFTVSTTAASWTYGRFGDLIRRGSTTWWGDIGLGGGRQGDEPLWYQGYRGGMTTGIVPRRLYGEIDGQFVRLGGVNAGAIAFGALVQPLSRVTAHASYHRSFSGGSDWQYLTLRSDVKISAAVGLLAGFSGGDCGSCEQSILEGPPLTQASREFFAGSSISFSRFETIGSVSVVHAPAGHVERVLFAVRVPLRAAPRAPAPQNSTPSSDK